MSDAEHRSASLEKRLDDLEQSVADLQEELASLQNQDVPLLKGTLRKLVAIDIESVHDLPAASQAVANRMDQHATRLDEVEAQLAALGDLTAEHSTKEQKIAAILAFAENKRGADQPTIAVTAPEIKGCAGVSRRYAYDLIEAMAEEIEGVSLREAKRVPTGTGDTRKQKAVLVDCEGVHERWQSVNSFTTRNGRETSE